MSTFTPVNGPCSGNNNMNSAASVAALTELIQKYQAVISTLTDLENDVGNISLLSTTDKSNLVAAVNEVDTAVKNVASVVASKADANKIGSLTNLTTTDKTNIVAAINETVTTIDNVAALIGSLSALDTENKTNVVTAINELKAAIDTTNVNLAALDATVAQKADKTTVGDLLSLTTADKTNIVAAINEVDAAIKTADTKLASRNELLDFDGMTKFSAPYAGISASGNDNNPNGVFLLAMLSENFVKNPALKVPKPGTLYLKYINTYPMDAIVDAMVSTNDKASLNVEFSRDSDGWQAQAFHIVEGTDSSGKNHYYIGISADSLTTAESYYKYTRVMPEDLPANPAEAGLYEFSSVSGSYVPTLDAEPVAAVDWVAWEGTAGLFYTEESSPQVGDSLWSYDGTVFTDTGYIVTATTPTTITTNIGGEDTELEYNSARNVIIPAKVYFERSTWPTISSDFYASAIDMLIPATNIGGFIYPNGQCTVIKTTELPDGQNSGTALSNVSFDIDTATVAEIEAMFDEVFGV